MSTISIGTYIDKKRLVFINKKAPKVRTRKENTRGLAAQVVSSSEWEKLPGDTTTRSFVFFINRFRARGELNSWNLLSPHVEEKTTREDGSTTNNMENRDGTSGYI